MIALVTVPTYLGIGDEQRALVRETGHLAVQLGQHGLLHSGQGRTLCHSGPVQRDVPSAARCAADGMDCSPDPSQPLSARLLRAVRSSSTAVQHSAAKVALRMPYGCSGNMPV